MIVFINIWCFVVSKMQDDYCFDCLPPEMADFHSGKGRIWCLKTLFQKIILLPFRIFSRAAMTFFRAVGVVFGVVYLGFTFGASPFSREYFLKRVLSLANDLAEWVFFPFLLILDLGGLLLGCTLHPSFYFRYSH